MCGAVHVLLPGRPGLSPTLVAAESSTYQLLSLVHVHMHAHVHVFAHMPYENGPTFDTGNARYVPYEASRHRQRQLSLARAFGLLSNE